MAKPDHTKAGQPAPLEPPNPSDRPQEPAQLPRQILVPARELQESTLRLRLLRSVVMTTVGALHAQAADYDIDFAITLRHNVAVPLLTEIERLEALLREGLA